MVGAIISAVAAVGSAVAGGIMGAKANREQKKKLAQMERENQMWYNRRYNEDATQRADAQRMLTQTAEAIRQRNQQIAGTQAVVGGTEEAAAAERNRNAQMQADVASKIASNAADTKDKVDEAYRNRKQKLDASAMDLEAARQENIKTATQGALTAVGNMASSFESASADDIKQTEQAETSTASQPQGIKARMQARREARRANNNGEINA